jgi:hypothetical protein
VVLAEGTAGKTATFTDLIGDADWAEVSSYYGVDNSASVSDLTLWYLEEEYLGEWYPCLDLREGKPDNWYQRNVEKARISISNVSLQLGIKIYLKK